MDIKIFFSSLEQITATPFFGKMVEDITEETFGHVVEDPLHFLNVHQTLHTFVSANGINPYKVKQALRSLEINKEEYLTHLHYLINRSFSQQNLSQENKQALRDMLYNEAARVSKELWPEEYEKFDNEKAKRDLLRLHSVEDKIKYLENLLEEYRNFKRPHFWNNAPFYYSDFEYQLKVLYDQLEKRKEIIEEAVNSGLFLTEKRGGKINFYRVLDALYEAQFFIDEGGRIPTKEKVFSTFGNFLGKDFSDFQTALSQAYNDSPVETNIKIFHELADLVKKKRFKE